MENIWKAKKKKKRRKKKTAQFSRCTALTSRGISHATPPAKREGKGEMGYTYKVYRYCIAQMGHFIMGNCKTWPMGPIFYKGIPNYVFVFMTRAKFLGVLLKCPLNMGMGFVQTEVWAPQVSTYLYMLCSQATLRSMVNVHSTGSFIFIWCSYHNI